MTKTYESQATTNIEGCTLTIEYTIIDHPVVFLHGLIEEPSYYEFDSGIILVEPIPQTAEAAVAVSNFIDDDDAIWKVCFDHWRKENEKE